MQPQRREVRVENDEYEREQQRLAKQIKRVVILINDHIFANKFHKHIEIKPDIVKSDQGLFASK